MKHFLVSALATLIFLGLAGTSQAGLIFTVAESGGGVTISYNGSLELVGNGAAFNNPAASIIDGTRITVNPNQPANFNARLFTGSFTGPTSFFPGLGEPDVNATSVTGGSTLVALSLGSGSIYTPTGFAGGTFSASGSMFFNGSSFASLGLTPGSQLFNWTQTGQSFNSTNVITVTAVPEPTSMLMVGSAVLGLCTLRRRKLV